MKMKILLAVVCSAALTAAVIHAQAGRQPQPYKVVFDLTSDDPLDQGALLRWLGEISVASPETEMEVVMYGRGLALVMPTRSARIDDVKEALGRTWLRRPRLLAERTLSPEESELLAEFIAERNE